MDENAATAPSKSPLSRFSHWSALQQRIATALVMLAVIAPLLWIGGWIFSAFVFLVAFQMNREWETLIPSREWYWRVAGVFYILVPAFSLLIIRNMTFQQSAEASLYAALFPLLLVTATDVGAYFSGRIIGGPKILPKISPKKTWAGLFGGMACSIGACLAMLPLIPWPETIELAIILAVFTTLFAQTGDFFESWLKRMHGVKDSGNLLPGHGGLLDRLDGYIFVLPLYCILLLLNAELLS